MTVPQYPPQPFCRYLPCQVLIGSFRSKCVCGAIMPWTSQYSGFVDVAATSVTDAIDVGKCGIPAKSVSACSCAQVIFAGIVGLVAASCFETLSSVGLVVLAPATAPEDPITATMTATATATAPRLANARVRASLNR